MTDLMLERLDLHEIFCDVDDFCQILEEISTAHPILPGAQPMAPYQSCLSLSEVMTIVIAFQGSGYRTFKQFYLGQVLVGWRKAFPRQVSYNRFVELMRWTVFPLYSFLHFCCCGEVTGISFIDSPPIQVCDSHRISQHKVFKNLAKRGKSSMGWFFGFKLHLIVNDRGELLAFGLTPGNVDDRTPVPELAAGLKGHLFGDRGYVSQALFETLHCQGLTFISRRKQKMKNTLMTLRDKILLRKRCLIETIHDQLKNLCQIEHSRHRSPLNFLVNVLAGLVAYSYHPCKPSLDIDLQDLAALPPTAF